MAAPNSERLVPVNLEGPGDLLDAVLLRLAPHLRFRPPERENAAPEGGDGGRESSCEELLARIRRIADRAMIPLEDRPIAAFTAGEEEIRRFVAQFAERFDALQSALLELTTTVEHERGLLEYLRRLGGMNVRLEEIFSCKYVKARFGRLPRDSGAKMDYFGDHMFLFFPFSESERYIWGVCFTINAFSAEIDNILDALFFERVRIPGDICGTPAEAGEAARRRCLADEARCSRTGEEFRRLIEENRARLVRFYNEARLLRALSEARRSANVYSGRFYLTGFAPRDSLRQLEAEAGRIGDVKFEILPRR